MADGKPIEARKLRSIANVADMISTKTPKRAVCNLLLYSKNGCLILSWLDSFPYPIPI